MVLDRIGLEESDTWVDEAIALCFTIVDGVRGKHKDEFKCCVKCAVSILRNYPNNENVVERAKRWFWIGNLDFESSLNRLQKSFVDIPQIDDLMVHLGLKTTSFNAHPVVPQTLWIMLDRETHRSDVLTG